MCLISIPIIDFSWTEDPKIDILQQWNYDRPRKDPFKWLSDKDGVTGERFPLWRSWRSEGGVTLTNTKWNRTQASRGIRQVKCYNIIAH